MGRETIRHLKRSNRTSMGSEAANDERMLGRESALALLERSIHFDHGRLAVLRLAIAVDVGACVPRELWTYCWEVAQHSDDMSTQELFRSAAQKAMAAGCEAPRNTDAA